MILKWVKFNESDNQDVITRDIIQEVLFFSFYTGASIGRSLLVKYESLSTILGELDLSKDITEGSLDKIYSEISGNLKEGELLYRLRSKFIEIYHLVSKKMEGFPRFYEMEDCVLNYIDNGYVISYYFTGKSMGMIISGYIDINQFAKLVSNSAYIINRLKNFTKKEIYVSDSEYVNKLESYLKIVIQ